MKKEKEKEKEKEYDRRRMLGNDKIVSLRNKYVGDITHKLLQLQNTNFISIKLKPSIGIVRNGGGRVTGLSRRHRLDGDGGRNRLPPQLRRQILNPIQIKGVKQLIRKDDLMQLDLPGHALKNSTSPGDGQQGVLISQVSALHRHVPVIAKVEAVDGLVAVAFLLGNVLDEDAYPCRYANALLEVAGVELVAEWDKVPQCVLLLLAQL